MSENKFGRRRFMTQGVATILPLINPVPMSCGPCQPREVALSDRSTDTRAYEEIRRLHVDNYINAVAWNADGSRLAALSNFGGTVTLWDSHSWVVVKEFHRYGGAYSANSLAFLPDGTLLTTAPGGISPDPRYATLAIFSLIQWNAETGQAVRYIPDLEHLPKDLSGKIGPTDTFVVSADGSLIASILGGNVCLFETHSWSVARWFATPPTPKHPDYAAALAISPNGRQVAVGTGSGYVHLFGIDDRAPALSFSAYADDIVPPLRPRPSCNAIAFSPDGRILATGRGLIDIQETDDGWIRLWRVEDGALVARLTGGKDSALTIAWSPSGDRLAVGDDWTLRLWQISGMPQPEQQPQMPKKIRDKSYSVAFSPSGVLAASDAAEVVIYA